MLNEIVQAIIPDNIKDVKVVKDTLDIFLDVLNEYSDISIDIKNIYKEDKEVIHEEFLKIYLDSIYTTFTSTDASEKLYNKLSEIYEGTDVNVDNLQMLKNFSTFLTNEYLVSNKEFNESKGKSQGFEYIYNLVLNSKILGPAFYPETNVLTPFVFSETDNVFEYTIEGAIPKEAFEIFVKPITHPVGWKYVYFRYLKEIFIDYFNNAPGYNVTELDVRCVHGDEDYLNNLNALGDPITDDLNNIIFPNSDDNEVVLIESLAFGDEFDNVRTQINFVNGLYLINNTVPVDTKLYNDSGEVIKNYGNCSLNSIYTDESVIIHTHDTFDIQSLLALMDMYSLVPCTGDDAGDLLVGDFILGQYLEVGGICMVLRTTDSVINLDITRQFRDTVAIRTNNNDLADDGSIVIGEFDLQRDAIRENFLVDLITV